MGRKRLEAASKVVALAWVPWLLVAALGNAVHAQQFDLCDYSPPQSFFIDLGGTVNLRAINNPGQQNTLFNGTAKADWVSLFDSPNFGTSADGNLNLDFADAARNTLNASLNGKLFIPESNVFFFGGVDLQGIRAIVPNNFSLLAGLGYGRFRDVTAIAKAIEIQTQLVRFGKFTPTARLREDEIKQMATLIDQYTANQPLSELINAIQRLLTTFDEQRKTPNPNNRLMTDPLGANSLLAIQNILQDPSATKFCGLETSWGLGPNSSGREQIFDLLIRFAFRYALAPTPRSQLILDTKFSFSEPNFRLGTFFLDSQAVYSYRLSNFLELQGRYAFLRSSAHDKPSIDIQVLNVALAFKNLSVGPIPMVGPVSLNLLIDLDWSKASGTLGWSRSININLGYEIF